MWNIIGDLDLTFDPAIMTFTFKILPGLYLRNCYVSEVDTLVGTLFLCTLSPLIQCMVFDAICPCCGHL